MGNSATREMVHYQTAQPTGMFSRAPATQMPVIQFPFDVTTDAQKIEYCGKMQKMLKEQDAPDWQWEMYETQLACGQYGNFTRNGDVTRPIRRGSAARNAALTSSS